MGRARNNAERLRNAVYAMPGHTKQAMLRGVRSNRIITGGYVDKRGGVCPMLAAHRNGGRTNFGTFARAWDAFSGAGRKPKRASRRDVRALEGYLEMALAREGSAPDGETLADRSLADEVRDVQASRRRLAETEAHEGADVPVEEVLATAYGEHATGAEAAASTAKLAEADALPDSAEAWSAELERAEAELERTTARR
jgi:hypothetical protein